MGMDLACMWFAFTFSMPYFSYKEKPEGALDMVYPAYQKPDNNGKAFTAIVPGNRQSSLEIRIPFT